MTSEVATLGWPGVVNRTQVVSCSGEECHCGTLYNVAGSCAQEAQRAANQAEQLLESEHHREAEYKALAAADAAAGEAFGDPCGLSEVEVPLRRVLLEVQVRICVQHLCTRVDDAGIGCSVLAWQPLFSKHRVR